MDRATVLIVDDKPVVARALGALAQSFGYKTIEAHSVEEALDRFTAHPCNVVLTDVVMGVLGGFDLLHRLHHHAPDVPVILMTGEASVEDAMNAIHAGAFDYLSKPVQHDHLGRLLERAVQHHRFASASPGAGGVEPPPEDMLILGRSQAMLDVFKEVAIAARGSASVLVQGENGTGKELVARTVHDRSPRASRPFFVANMAAIQRNLAESELFGHMRGSFTGADRDNPGLFERADGSTLFFDEIGELPLELQPKMLRAIQEKRISRVGEIGVEREVDLRIVCATNRDLWSEVKNGRFREDLYFRLAVVPIRIPSLRERVEDIPDLARHFARWYSRQAGRETPEISQDAMDRLLRHPWPGNVRELQNVLQRAVQFSSGGVITADNLRIDHLSVVPQPILANPVLPGLAPRYLPLREVVSDYIDEVLASVGQNVTHAARVLGVSRKTVQRHIAERRNPSELNQAE